MSRRCSVTLLDEGNQSAKVTVFYCFTDPRGPREDWESRGQGCHRRHRHHRSRHTYSSPQEPPDWLIASIVADNAQIETCENKGTSDHILHFLSYFHHGQFTPAVQSGQGAHSFSHNLNEGRPEGNRHSVHLYAELNRRRHLPWGRFWHDRHRHHAALATWQALTRSWLIKSVKVGNLVPSSYRLMIFKENQRGRQSKQSRLLGFNQACKINLQRKHNKIKIIQTSNIFA